MKAIRKPVLFMGALLTIQLGACSSGPPPKQDLSLSQAAVRKAEAAGANDYAPVQLRAAQLKLEKAQTQIEKKNHKYARRLLQQATVDAELAEASAEASKSGRAYEELQQSIDLMKQEIARLQD